MKEFDPQTLVHLNDKFYVYILRDSGNGEVFYVGKGKGNRIFSHETEAKSALQTDKEKLSRIHEIEKRGNHVEHIIIHYGLSESEAFSAESALLNYIKYISPHTLTNFQSGHHSTPAMNAETFNDFYGAKELLVEDIEECVIVIKINRTYTMGQSPEDIKDFVRGHWKLNINRATKAKYIFALFRGWIVGVYEIEKWYSSTEKTDFFPQPENFTDPKLKDRKYCTCHTVDSKSDIGRKYLYKMIHEFSKSTQNPISYIEPSINSKNNQNLSLLSMQKNCLKKCIPFLQNIYDNVEKRKWCEIYSVYSQNSNDLWKLESQIHLLMQKYMIVDWFPRTIKLSTMKFRMKPYMLEFHKITSCYRLQMIKFNLALLWN